MSPEVSYIPSAFYALGLGLETDGHGFLRRDKKISENFCLEKIKTNVPFFGKENILGRNKEGIKKNALVFDEDTFGEKKK